MNIGIVTQARMNSTRLPGKILKTICNKPILKYHIDRLKICNLKIFIATSHQPIDDQIVDFCYKNEISYYRGDEHNVLSRYYDCATLNHLDTIIRVTSDCPLIDGALISKALDCYLGFNDELVYLSNAFTRTFPRGLDFEIFSYAALKTAYENATTTYQKEHVTPYIYENIEKINIKDYLNSNDSSEYRITLDTIEDFSLIKILIEDFDCEHKSAQEIISVFENNPYLKSINQNVIQKT
jgi:spore coat polysaccharide biosynthesis protein SpsF